MKKMILITALTCAAATAPEALAQGGTSGDTGVYSAEVIGRSVKVRSGPAASAYYCVELSSPTRMTVVGQSRGWLKVLAPNGCYSVVNKKSVRASADGKTGVIIGENVWARAGGFPAEPGQYSMLQKALKADQKVMILGQTGDYYKIIPPSGAYFWVEAKSVKRVGGGVVTPPVPTTRPATTRPIATTRPAVPEVVYKPHPDILALKALDKEVTLECKKPFKDRNYEALLDKYRALKPTKESGIAPYVAARIEGLEVEISRQKDAEAAAQLAAQTEEARRKFEIAKAKIGTGSTTQPAVVYTSKGIVAPSVLFPKGKTPRRFLLRDAKAVKINAYILNTDGKVDLVDYVGKLVEVYGQSGFDGDLGMDTVDVQKVVVVSEQAVLPDPPAPTVVPADKPEPPADKPKPPAKAPAKVKAA